MRRPPWIPAVLALAVAGCTSAAPTGGPSVDGYVRSAQTLAGDDLKPLLPLCNAAPAQRPGGPEIEKFLAAMIARPAPEPARAFDNLYYVGAAWVSAWVIRTSAGLILIDALNNADEARTLIEGGLRRLGLDPKDIRYVLVTHAHGDHYGGLDYLSSRYGFGVVMSTEDWKQAEGKLEFDSPQWGRPPKFRPGKDLKLDDGGTLVLGDTTVRINITPGHTHGTITPTFDVADGGRRHRALLWGGTAFNFGKDIPRLDGYVAGAERMAALARREGIDVMISNHPSYDDSLRKFAQKRAGTATNPFVIGTDAVVRGLGVMENCARAQRLRFLQS